MQCDVTHLDDELEAVEHGVVKQAATRLEVRVHRAGVGWVLQVVRDLVVEGMSHACLYLWNAPLLRRNRVNQPVRVVVNQSINQFKNK